MTSDTVFSPDLDGIEVGETCLSEVRGDEGTLSYRGQAIDTLIDRPFTDVIWKLLFDQWPDVNQTQALSHFMDMHSALEPFENALLEALPRDLHPMLMLQGMVPLLSLKPKHTLTGLNEAAHSGLIIAAKLPTLVAYWRQLELGNTPAHTTLGDSCHENFLMMFNGADPSAEQVQLLNAAQILQMEHGYNAGTFAGRVCASTLAPMQSSISASIGTLFGVLHGGADQAALEMAEKIGAPEHAKAYVEASLKNKVKIMGMGHREYKVLDPRAKLLKPMARSMCNSGDAKRLFDTLAAVEEACQEAFRAKGKDIHANVEFYKGAVFNQLGVPSHYFTALFSMARVYGYIAHYLEFSQNSKLIRPRARYVGK